MFSVKNVLRRIREDEGFRSQPYQCTSDVWTIGYGTTRLFGRPVTADTPPISTDEARVHLHSDVLQAIHDCQLVYGETLARLHPVHQEILICLAYQLGIRNLRGFKRMKAAICDFDYEGWERELLDSKLARQARKRVLRYVDAIRTAQWPWDKES
jgi:lysozyme